ncbi:PREDICTED: CAAX prenyl protease 2, partial [Tinamus guttatus]|uniref:CAAX prenyl protease 2 n=1 Tax=Tinamus guttatus TaxID=94827 RepID=UPI00052E88C0
VLFLGPLIQLSMDCPWHWLDGLKCPQPGDTAILACPQPGDTAALPCPLFSVFRACMVPVLLPCTGPARAVLACPLFFGVAHFHHVIEQLRFRQGSVGSIFMAAAFQFSYTALFGAYTAFIFLRTGEATAR